MYLLFVFTLLIHSKKNLKQGNTICSRSKLPEEVEKQKSIFSLMQQSTNKISLKTMVIETEQKASGVMFLLQNITQELRFDANNRNKWFHQSKDSRTEELRHTAKKFKAWVGG